MQPWHGTKQPSIWPVCRIDNSVTTQRCNIPLPKVNSFLNRIQICKIGDSPAPYFFLKIGILYVEKFLSGILRHPKIKQCTEQIFCPCSSKGILISIYSGCSFCSCLIKYNRLCVCVIFHSSRITACCGQISKQFPQCRQCSCRIIAGMEVKSIQFCGQTVPQARQPSAAQLSDFAADRYCRTRHCIFAFHTCHRYISIGF